MGCSISAINDDMDDLADLVRKAGTRSYDVYSKEASLLEKGYELGLRGVILEKYISKEVQKLVLEKQIQDLDTDFEDMVKSFNKF